MKHLLLAAALLLATSALADSPDAILKDYRARATQAVERLNQSLEKATTPLITKLVRQGDTAGAELLTSQLKAKVAGEPFMVPHPSAASLFSLYDEARAKALVPVQKSSIARIESMLKTAGGPKLETVTELGRVRGEIDGGRVAAALDNGSKFILPSSWDYYSDANKGVAVGKLIWNADGTLALMGTKNNSTPGRWEATSNTKVFKVFLGAGSKEEKCELRINGNEAELIRAIGTRYLTAR
jgi:hypothetical protein